MALTVVHNTPDELDYPTVGTSIRAAYGRRGLKPPPHDLAWRYQKGFGSDSVILSVHDDEIRIGQAVVMIRSLGDGRRIALLGDLYVDAVPNAAFAAMLLYRNLQALLEDGQFSLIYTVPNQTAADLDRKVLGLDQVKKVEVSLGFVFGRTFSGGLSGRAADATDFLPDEGPSMLWRKADLANRVAAPCQDYVVGRSHNVAILGVTRKVGPVKALVLAAAYGEGRAEDWKKAIGQCAKHTRGRVVLNGTGRAAVPGVVFGSIPKRYGRTFNVSYRIGKDGADLAPKLQFLDLDVM
ncbi:MAG: hypothetical protein AAGI12_06430 [Pseudomonadota bacterium]